ncbi:hypothetical protein pb186bvf_015920 [Paramecium bursaria]
MFNNWPEAQSSYIFQADPQYIKEQQEQISTVMCQILRQISQINALCFKSQLTETNINVKPAPKVIVSQQFDENSESIKEKKSLKKRKSKQQRVYIQGRWSLREHRQYLSFLDKFYMILNQADLKSEQQIFKKMSMQIRSRTPTQCRSHHKRFDFQGYLLKIYQTSSAT